MSTVRLAVGTQLAADWADIPALSGLVVKVSERVLDDIKRPTALIRQKGVGKAPSLPNSHRNVSLLLTLISPFSDLDGAAAQLDPIVEAALDYLDTRFLHEDATAADYGDRLAYDIPFTVLASKE